MTSCVPLWEPVSAAGSGSDLLVSNVSTPFPSHEDHWVPSWIFGLHLSHHCIVLLAYPYPSPMPGGQNLSVKNRQAPVYINTNILVNQDGCPSPNNNKQQNSCAPRWLPFSWPVWAKCAADTSFLFFHEQVSLVIKSIREILCQPMTNMHIYFRNYQKFNVHWKSPGDRKEITHFPNVFNHQILWSRNTSLEQCPQRALNKTTI